MKLLTQEIVEKLIESGDQQRMRPICKLFAPWHSAIWLITGMNSNGKLYGYADFGMGCVQWGGIATLKELASIRGPGGLGIERDLHFSDDPSVNYLDRNSLVGV